MSTRSCLHVTFGQILETEFKSGLNLTWNEISRRSGISVKQLYRIRHGSPVTERSAKGLSRCFNTTFQYWTNLYTFCKSRSTSNKNKVKS